MKKILIAGSTGMLGWQLYKTLKTDYGFIWSEDKKNSVGNHHWFLFKK